MPTSPDVISHQDLPVPFTASEDAYCDPKYIPTLSDSDLGVSNEVKICIPSPVAPPDQSDVTTHSSEVKEALSHVESALSHAYGVLYEHSIQHDIKLHSPNKLSLNIFQLSVLPHLKSPLIKWPQFSMETVLIT